MANYPFLNSKYYYLNKFVRDNQLDMHIKLCKSLKVKVLRTFDLPQQKNVENILIPKIFEIFQIFRSECRKNINKNAFATIQFEMKTLKLGNI